ncbi:MAG: hypothetical protein HYX51_06025 [Chloroflexi bacterium]|nr:hypothetical protein [Chloroflexota bacterium]
MNHHRLLIALSALILALVVAACSPEDGRKRGEKGADVGNRPADPASVELHGSQNPSFDVPLVGRGIEKERR